GKDFQTAVAWYSIFIQSAVILGPSLGGLVYAAFRGPAAVYTLSFIAAALGAMSTVAIKAQSNPRLGEPMSWKTMLAGFHYIRSERLILGSISLDLVCRLLLEKKKQNAHAPTRRANRTSTSPPRPRSPSQSRPTLYLPHLHPT